MLIFLVEDVSLFMYIVFFTAIVIAFGLAFTLLTPICHGIGQNLKPLPNVTYSDGIYFSIFTISSLGYSNIHPMGISKALVCAEVLLGLAVIGIMIAKVTAQRLSYHVSRLFSSDAQKRLEGIAEEFDLCRSELTRITRVMADTYQSTPVKKLMSNRESLKSDFRQVIAKFGSRCIALREYFADEIAQGKYFHSVPVSAVMRVGDPIDGALFILGQLIISLSPQARTEILDRHNRQRISESINSQRQVCAMVRQHATDQNTLDVFQRIEETCNQMPSSYFSVPVSEELRPGQILRGSDEPQQPLEEDNENTESL